jgi:hypothetical protein
VKRGDRRKETEVRSKGKGVKRNLSRRDFKIYTELGVQQQNA